VTEEPDGARVTERHTDGVDVDPDEHRHLEEPVHEPVEMSHEDFEQAVGDALDEVPPPLMDLLDNVVFLVEDEPPEDDPDLLGVYDGVPLTERGDLFGAAMPDRITIYRGPTLRMCRDRDEVIDEVAVTVVHEIAHHFGIDDAKLHALGWG
jgi:predicted Zn-dependent protease with MMP-like domain